MKPVKKKTVEDRHDPDMEALLQDGSIKELNIYSHPLTYVSTMPLQQFLPSLLLMGAIVVVILLVFTDVDLDDIFPFLDSSDSSSSDSDSSDSGDPFPQQTNSYQDVLSGMDLP